MASDGWSTSVTLRVLCSARTLLGVCLLLATAAFLAGCGRDTGGRVAVSGDVKFKNAPLETGTIDFVSEDGGRQSGAMITAGKYAIPADKGLLPGKYKVRISCIKESGPASQGAPGPEAELVTSQELIPEQYNVNSTLTAEVTAGGQNNIPFDLK